MGPASFTLVTTVVDIRGNPLYLCVYMCEADFNCGYTVSNAQVWPHLLNPLTPCQKLEINILQNMDRGQA